MAITNARMQIKRGNEVDFDSEKMLVGEWALSTDKKIVRICVAPNVCIRMATYDAFEADVAKIQGILEEVQTIEEAVTRINTEISEKANAVSEYTEQSKGYRDETKQFRDGAETSATNAKSSEDKAKVSETNAKVSETNAKISEENAQRVAESLPEDYTELSKAFYNTAIKQKAVGENIHVTDSANGKNVAFGLYGKAEQKQYSGKNLLNPTLNTTTLNGVTCTSNGDGTYTVNGTASATTHFYFMNNNSAESISVTDCKLVGCPSGGSLSTYSILCKNNGTFDRDVGSGLSIINGTLDNFGIRIESGKTVNNLVFKPMLTTDLSATYDDFEPYVGGIASPNPDYPQEITVAGASGSVEVVSCGKNLLKNTLTTYTVGNLVFTSNEDGIVNVNGQTSDVSISSLSLCDMGLVEGNKYILSGGASSSVRLYIYYKEDWTKLNVYSNGNDVSFTVPITGMYRVYIRVLENATVTNALVKPMLRLASDTDSTFEPYTETTSTIPTPNGLCGIKVSSGGNYTDENGQQWISDVKVKYADGSGKNIEWIKHYSLAVADMNNQDDYPGWYGISDLSEAIGSVIGRINTPLMLNVGTVCNANTTSSNVIYLPTGTYGMTQTEWKTKYPDMVVEIYLARIEPITTDLSAEEIAEIEKLYTFYPITNISNDADCGMSVTYLCDAKNYIDNRLALIETALVNSI